MITIDIVHEYNEKTEKPRTHASAALHTYTGVALDGVYALVKSRHEALIQAAHQSRLAKAAKEDEIPVDVQRYTERRVSIMTLVERYASRIVGLVGDENSS